MCAFYRSGRKNDLFVSKQFRLPYRIHLGVCVSLCKGQPQRSCLGAPTFGEVLLKNVPQATGRGKADFFVEMMMNHF